MPTLAVTVLGHDRPGIIADVTGVLAALGGNLEDSSMTLLRGHFAMTMLVTVEAAPDDVEARLTPLLEGLTVSVRELPDEEPPQIGTTYVLSVHGGDRPGIVSTVTRLVASHGGNIIDLTTRLAGDLYLLVAEVTLPSGTDEESLHQALDGVAKGLGVDVSLHVADTDVL